MVKSDSVRSILEGLTIQVETLKVLTIAMKADKFKDHQCFDSKTVSDCDVSCGTLQVVLPYYLYHCFNHTLSAPHTSAQDTVLTGFIF